MSERETPLRESYAGADLSGKDLSRQDLSGADFSGAILIGAILQGTNLSRANLQGANLQRANLMGANLDEADLTSANLDNANAYTVQARGANFNKATLISADLSYAILDGADFSDAELYNANLSNAKARNIVVDGANFTSTDIEEAEINLIRKDWKNPMWGLRLVGVGSDTAISIAEGAIYQNGEKIRAQKLPYIHKFPIQWLEEVEGRKPRSMEKEAAFILHAKVCKDYQGEGIPPLAQTDARGIAFNNLDLSYGIFEGVDFSQSTFSNTCFVGTEFRNCNFTGCRFNSDGNFERGIKPTFTNCNFSDAVFAGSSHRLGFEGGTFLKCNFIFSYKISFKNCALEGATFDCIIDCEFSGCTFKGAEIQGSVEATELVRCSLDGLQTPYDFVWTKNVLEAPEDFLYLHTPDLRALVIDGPSGRRVFLGDPSSEKYDLAVPEDTQVPTRLSDALDFLRK